MLTLHHGRGLTLARVLFALLWATPHPHAQAPAADAAVQQIMQADADFAAAVASRNRERFLSFIADATTFNGGTPGEIHGRDAVLAEWSGFFEAGGPTLSWAPTRGAVIGAGDVGYTTGRSVMKGKGPTGVITERLGEYLTVWRKQRDGSWKVVFDTGSTLPPR
jgi:ketosteroid isomerase-like protein